MTLYIETEYSSFVRPVMEASRADRLRADGWDTCGTCGGYGVRGGCRNKDCNHEHTFSFCPDCVDGLQPPDGMIEAAARGAFGDETFNHDGSDWFLSRQEVHTDQARAALVAAARWESE